MRCSNCNENIKPIIAVDIDGTLADYHSHFLWFAGLYLGVDIDRVNLAYDGSIKFKSWFCEAFGGDDHTWNDIKLAYRQGGMKRSMPIFAGAMNFMEKINELGAEVWITTTRPHLRLDGIDPDTRFWLQRAGINYYGLLYDEDKYRVLANRVDYRRVVAIVDDLPEQYDSAAECFGSKVPILRQSWWNRAVIRPTCGNTFNEIYSRIEWRINGWYDEFGFGHSHSVPHPEQDRV